MNEVTIGERSVAIPRFSAFKVVRAGRLMAVIAKKYPAIMLDVAKFTREYEQENSVRITRAMAKTPRFSHLGFGAKDFEATGYVELPTSPSTYEQVIAVFPAIMEAAENEVVAFCALILAPNNELAEADENDQVDEYLKQKAKALLHEADGDQLIDIAVVAASVAREQFAHKLGDMGNAAALFTGSSNVNGATTTASTPNSQESSSDSPTPSNGDDEKSSLELAGRS